MAVIYVSSTYEDLKDHRDGVYRALRQLDHDVRAMEDYVATDARPLDKCLQDVAAADLYLGIFAWRYGFVPDKDNPQRQSITEREYRHAVDCGKPCLIFLLHEDADWKRKFDDAATAPDRGEHIAKLRAELKNERTVSTFHSAEELARLASTAVANWEKETRPASAGPGATARNLIQTEGGAYVAGNVDTGGGEFVGRDKHETHIHHRIARHVEGPCGIGPASTPAESPGERQITRYTDIVFPRRIWVTSPRVPVVVRLTVQRSALSAAVEEMVLREHLPVQVRIEAPLFEILNAPRQDINLVRDQDSAPVVFDLRPRQVGHTDITLDFFQSGDPVGTATVAVEVTPYEVAEGAEARPARPLHVEPDVVPPDRVLHIAWNQRGSALRFTLIQEGGASWNDGFRPVPINGNPAAHAAEFYRQITSLVGAADPTADAILQRQLQIPFADVDRRVKRLGQNLWREFIPDELKSLYSRERNRWRNQTTLIFSDEPHIPWELVWPYEAGAWEDEGPWCQTLRLTRWLRKDDRGNGNDKAPGRMAANALAVLAPTYSLLENLPSAQQERQLLLGLIRQHELRDVSPPEATWQSVMNLLEAGGYDWVHVASHGNFYPEAPDGDSALWLQRDNALTPQQIAGMQIEGYLRQHRPAFFFNACEVGRQGWALTRIGGWANRLISCGASLFVGPLWSVGDSSALTFANAFYQSLFSGDTVASATQQARLAAQRVGDPTYLAYSVYGHPNARLM